MTETTRIGLLSDIHANAVALRAVLDDMEPVDALVCAGDIVGYGPSPQACLHMIRDREIPTVVGNHDREVVRGMTWESGDEYARRVLSADDIEWLGDLPRELRLFDERLKIVHDPPDEQDRYTEPADFVPTLLEDEDVLVLGHTHIQHAETFNDGLVINPGSVGQPRDGNPDAAYAIVDLSDLSVDLYRVPYDIERVQQRIEGTSISDRNGERLAFE
ncbi:metallophosphoesterase family protein [Haloarcula sp. H-GB4]|uniref:metallophosphoesterase family protein n=1 Tax=Haloarcula sp. H-GB4 TaxID=3069755 RepID=UPI0027B6BEA1|nr:metallophosphoesterase family protein [Haloarcula sp. H-GB4]MDQ2074719.1 metallophosphoesterase family protein [Haloarcula sp. H-GB4]